MKIKSKTSLVMAAGVVVLIAAAAYFGRSAFSTLTDPDRARAVITDAGPWGPVVFIAMQVAQVFFAPIPGQAVGFIGGYLFGAWLGTLYAMVGAAIGFSLIFILARRLGRPFVEYFVDKKHLDKFDYIAKSKGVFVFFLIFLLPAFPDDIICYIAGLTAIRIRTLILISLLGRLPGYFILSLTGSGVAENNTTLAIGVFGGTMVISGIAYWQRKRLEAFTKRLSERK